MKLLLVALGVLMILATVLPFLKKSPPKTGGGGRFAAMGMCEPSAHRFVGAPSDWPLLQQWLINGQGKDLASVDLASA